MGQKLEENSPKTYDNNYLINNRSNNSNTSSTMFKDRRIEKEKVMRGYKPNIERVEKSQCKKSLNRQMMKKLRLELF